MDVEMLDRETVQGRRPTMTRPATKKDGLGMGLFICQSIVNSLGGQIALQRAAADGSTFRVELPLVTA
jgi:C4-dicarboxylate-specific signal transduction histidine kinase